MTILESPQRLLACLLVTALLLASCGGSDQTGDEVSEEDQAFVDAMTSTFSEQGAAPEGVDTTCVSRAFVSGLGGASAIESTYGITAADAGANGFDGVALSEPDARSVVDGMWECDGFDESLYAELAGASLNDAQVLCLQESLDDAPLKTLLAASFMGADGEAIAFEMRTEFELTLFDGFATCGIA